MISSVYMISLVFIFSCLISTSSGFTFHVDVETLVGGGVSGFQQGDSSSPSEPNGPLFTSVGGIGLDPVIQQMCITDQAAYEVRSVDIPTKQVSSLGGVPNVPGYNDGQSDPNNPADFTLYDTPRGCATTVTPAGLTVTFVADSWNCMIRRIGNAFSQYVCGANFNTEPYFRQGLSTSCSDAADSLDAGQVRWSADIETVIVTPNGNLWVVDSGNVALRLVSTTDNPPSTFPFGATKTIVGQFGDSRHVDGAGLLARFQNPTRMQYVASLRTLFIVDGNRIRAVQVPVDEINGIYSVSTFGPSPLPFTPLGLALDDVNNIMYVTSDNNQLYAMVSTPTYETFNIVIVAGSTTGATGVNNGVGTAARFNTPKDIQFQRDPSGNAILYINDQGNFKIRQVNVTYKPSSVVGDPQFIGFQGQTYQVHGQPDEIFNLISAPDLSMNANFVYLQTSSCNYTNTKCFTHPGTYVDAIGLRLGFDDDDQVKIVAGSNSKGLRVWHNNTEMEIDEHIYAMDNEISIIRGSKDRVDIKTPTFMIGIINSDGFFNLELRLTDMNALVAGRTRRVGKDIKNYPYFPYHGLIGQTWRNSFYPHSNSPIEGEVDDYRIESHDLFGLDYTYNTYLKKKGIEMDID